LDQLLREKNPVDVLNVHATRFNEEWHLLNAPQKTAIARALRLRTYILAKLPTKDSVGDKLAQKCISNGYLYPTSLSDLM